MAGNKKPNRKAGGQVGFAQARQKGKAEYDRRLAQKNERIHKINNLPLGHPLNQRRIEVVFGPLERVLDEQESTGSLLFDEDGRAIMRDVDGGWYLLVPALLHMTHLYDVMADRLGWDEQPAGLRAFATKLAHEIRISQQDIEDARATLAWMRRNVATVTPAQFTELYDLAGELDKREDERAREAGLAAERMAA